MKSSISNIKNPPKEAPNEPSDKSNASMATNSSDTSSHRLLPIGGRTKLRRLLVVTLFFIGLIVCVSSLACLILLPSFVSNQVAKRLVLKNNSLLLERWSKPNVPMYFKVWLFDVQNAQELVDKRATKPQLKELGPFVFHLKRQKDVISFSGDNLYYTERKIYRFSQELSCCAINTTVTVPNIPLVAVVDRALSYKLPLVGRFIPRLINRAIQSLREQLFVKKQVGELLFDGYEVELLKVVSRVGALVGLPQTGQKFAILKGRNDSWRPDQDGVWAINTGVRDRRQFGRVASWNSYRQLPFWAGAGCNMINGSDGTLFPPPIKTTEPLYIFNQELCRTVNLVYQQKSNIHSIQSLRFVLNPLNFARTSQVTDWQPQGFTSTSSTTKRPSIRASNSSELPKAAAQQNNLPNSKLSEQERLIRAAQEAQAKTERNLSHKMNPFSCFCDRKTTTLNGASVCEFDGLIDLSKCTKQAQVIFGSMPHFHQADPRLGKQVTGLVPNATKHTTFLDIEPNTGLVLGGKRRVQLNVLIKHNNEIDGFENINDMLVPVVWFEESAQIPEETAQKFKSLYTNRIRLVNIILISLVLASLGLLAIDLRLLLVQNHWRRMKLNNRRSSSSNGNSSNGLSSVTNKIITSNLTPATATTILTNDQRNRKVSAGNLNLPLLANFSIQNIETSNKNNLKIHSTGEKLFHQNGIRKEPKLAKNVINVNKLDSADSIPVEQENN